jgi:hypothetical protein
VEFNYEKKLETLEEILNLDVVYGYHPAVNYNQDTVSFPEFVKFLEYKELKEDCTDARKCVERLITKRDVASVSPPLFATYVAREMGTPDVGKIVCSLDQLAVSGSLTILFRKGNPLLDRFNILMRRYLEAALMQLHWPEQLHRATLRGEGKLGEAALPAFVVLLVGTVLSSVVFIAEVTVKCLWRVRRK